MSSVFIDIAQCLAYINAHTKAMTKRAALRVTQPSITISRQVGAGGVSIAAKLAGYLQAREPAPGGWTVFDKNLVEKVLEEHNLPIELAKYMPEDRVSATQSMLGELFGLHPSAATLMRQTTETLLHLATLGNVILIGRGSAVVTRAMENVFHVRLVAPLEERVRYVMSQKRLKRDAALDFVKKGELARKRYLKANFRADIDDNMLYDLVINTARIPHDQVAQLIGDALLNWAKPGK